MSKKWRKMSKFPHDMLVKEEFKLMHKQYLIFAKELVIQI